MQEAQHLLATGSVLGEGPLWNVEQQTLYWLDIKGSILHKYLPQGETHHAIELSQRVTSFGFRESGGLVVTTYKAFAFWDENTQDFTILADPESEREKTRFNDGAVDPAGRFWAGSMSEGEQQPNNRLYRLDTDTSVHVLRDDVMLSNGLGWSPDHKTMYFTDSPRRIIHAYDYDSTTGSIENERVFTQLPEEEGVPDGMTVDKDGCVWSAVWGGWKVIRFDPDGQRMSEIKVAAERVTSCMFGGPNLDTLYITTARADGQAQSGDLFYVQTDTSGLPEPRFKG